MFIVSPTVFEVEGVFGPSLLYKTYGLGTKLRYMDYFTSLLHPQEEKIGYYFQSEACFGALEIHVLLSFLWSIFCKWLVINVTLLTLKIAVHKIKTNKIFLQKYQ